MPYLSPTEFWLLALVTTAAFIDIRSRRIPNWLTLGGVITGLSVQTVYGGFSGLKAAAAGMTVAFGLYFLLYLLHAMGAGDVKLMAGVGALVGPAKWMTIFAASAIAGGILALAAVIVKRRLRSTLWNVLFMLNELLQFRAPFERRSELDVKSGAGLSMPHAVAIAAGAAIFVVGNRLGL